MTSAPALRRMAAIVEGLERRLCLSASFSTPAFYTGVNSATGIAAADFNGDGKADIAVAGLSPTSSIPVIGVYLNQNGSFGTPTLFPFSGAPAGIAAGDFLGNGHQDIAVVDSSSNTLDVFLGDGAGNFTPGAGASLGGSGGDTAIVSADFNGDHRDDVAVLDPAANSVVIFTPGNSFGSFSLAQSISVPSPLNLVVGDFNGDQHPDLAVLSGNGSVYVALNNGAGVLGAPTAYSLGANVSSPVALAAGTFTSSAASDLIGVGVNGQNGEAGFLFGQTSGTFEPATDVALSAVPNLVVTGDFTTAGVTDAALLTASGGLTVLPGNGDGTFATPQSIFTSSLGAPATQAVVDDFGAGPGIAFLSSSQNGFGVTISGAGGGTNSSSNLTPTLKGSLGSSVVAGAALKGKETLTLTAHSAASGSARATILLSPDKSAADSVLTLASAAGKLNLKAGKAKTFALKLPKSIPATVAAGKYHVLIESTDTAGVVTTVDSGQTVNVVAPVVDLTGSVVKAPLTVKAGKKFTLTLLIANSSAANVAAVGLLPFDVETSPDPLLADAAPLLSETHRISIKPGKSIRLTITATLASSAYLVVNLDPKHAAFPNDLNLSNNVFATSRAIMVG